MAGSLNKPGTGPGWVRWVTQTLNRLDARRPVEAPVGSMVLWPGGTAPPAQWLSANGATFSSATYPLLAAQLGGTTLPNPTAVSGLGWIIRAT